MDLAGKLQLGRGESVAIVNAPEDAALALVDHPIADRSADADAVIVCCANRAELGKPSDEFVPLACRDSVTWVAYGTDLTRDVLARLVRTRGVRPVRRVALDDVWSARRLRPA